MDVCVNEEGKGTHVHFEMNTPKMEKNLVNLKILSNVEVGDKLSMRDKDFLGIDKPTFWQGIKRWFSTNSRVTTIENVKKVVNNTLNITNCALKQHQASLQSRDQKMVVNPTLPRYLTYMNAASKGLGSLARSYENDVTTFQVLDGYVTKFNDQCRTIECALMNHGNYTSFDRYHIENDVPLAEEVDQEEEDDEENEEEGNYEESA